MAGPSHSRSSRKSGSQSRTGRAKPRVPIRTVNSFPDPITVQQHMGNRGAIAFAESTFKPESPAKFAREQLPDEAGLSQTNQIENTKVNANNVTESRADDTSVALVEQKTGVQASEESRDNDSITENKATPDSGELLSNTDTTTTDTTATDTATSVISTNEALASGSESEATPESDVAISGESPGAVLQQIVNVRPTASLQAYGKASEVSAVALKNQTDQAQSELPEIPAPTGIAPKSKTVETKVEIGSRETVPQKLEGEQSGREQPLYPTNVDSAPPAPPPSPTVLKGKEESDTEGGDTEIAHSAQNALGRVQLFSGTIPGTAGKRPSVDMSGAADPSQLGAFEQSSGSTVTGAKLTAQKEPQQDFGEHDIFPMETTDIIRSERKLRTGSSSATSAEQFQIPDDISGALDQSLGSAYRDRIGEQNDEYLAGEADYHSDSKAAHGDAQREIKNLEESTKQEQLAQREGAQSLVAGYRQEWQFEIDDIDQSYRDKATRAGKNQRSKIEKERIKGESKAQKHLDEAEKKVTLKKQKAQEDVRREKSKKRKKSGGFWGWAKRAASALVDALKKAVNIIYDNLRKAVKFVFEMAKKQVLAAIEFARMAIVGLITAYGAILKGFVTIALLAFPEKAKYFNSKIDGAVDTAVAGVNKAAEVLKSGVSAIIDFLASTIDSILGLIQSIYNGIFTVIGMIIRGEFKEILDGISNLVTAAKMAPSRFETAAYEELLGGNLDEPLSPKELQQAGYTSKLPDGGVPAGDGQFPDSPYTTANIGVDAVDNNMELSPELTAMLQTGATGNSFIEFGESDDRQRTIGAIKNEIHGDAPGPEAKQPKYPPDGLSPTQRAAVKWKNMKAGLSKWWQDNKVAIIAGTVAAIVALVAAIIVSGGAILAAIPPIMSVLGPIFIGATIAAIGTRVRDYVSQSWAGNIKEGSKSLAKGLAAGAIELISYLTFKVGGAALKAGKATVKAGAKAARGAFSAVRRGVAAGAKYTLSKGKLLFKGIAGSGIAKRAKNLRDLGKQFLSRMRFKKFRIGREGMRFYIEGFINPWILLVSGELKEVSFAGQGKGKGTGHKTDLGEFKKGKNAEGEELEGFVVGIRNKPSGYVDDLRSTSKKDNAALFKDLKNSTTKKAREMIKGYDRLGFSYTTDSMRKSVQGKPYLDPYSENLAQKYLKAGETMEPDHIFPVREIMDLKGFFDISKAQRIAIVHDTVKVGNIMPLPKSLNRSKANLMGDNWKVALGKPTSKAYRNELQRQQELIRAKIEAKIAEFLGNAE